MPDLVTHALNRSEVSVDCHQIGSRVLISQGPLKGLSGFVSELAGEEVLVDLRCAVAGLLVRCDRRQLASQAPRLGTSLSG